VPAPPSFETNGKVPPFRSAWVTAAASSTTGAGVGAGIADDVGALAVSEGDDVGASEAGLDGEAVGTDPLPAVDAHAPAMTANATINPPRAVRWLGASALPCPNLIADPPARLRVANATHDERTPASIDCVDGLRRCRRLDAFAGSPDCPPGRNRCRARDRPAPAQPTGVGPAPLGSGGRRRPS